MNVLLKLGLCALLFSCGSEQKQQTKIRRDTIDTSLIPDPPPHIQKAYVKPEFERKMLLSELSVAGIYALYDSAYHDLSKPDVIFEPDKITHRYLETAFDTSGIYRYYNKPKLSVVEYINSDYAAFAFRKMYDLIAERQNNQLERYYTDEGFALEGEVLSKSGIIYWLKDNYIISRLRYCNDDWKKNERFEKEFTRLLYSQKPESKWFIRLCCSCPGEKALEMR